MAFGTGSAVAHRAVDAVMGPRTIQHETVVSEAAAATPAPTTSSLGGDACNVHSKAFQDVCSFYLFLGHLCVCLRVNFRIHWHWCKSSLTFYRMDFSKTHFGLIILIKYHINNFLVVIEYNLIFAHICIVWEGVNKYQLYDYLLLFFFPLKFIMQNQCDNYCLITYIFIADCLEMLI